MSNSYEKSVKKYFKLKAKNYDDVEYQVYWNLSDSLLWYLLKFKILDKLKNKKIKVLDAGGGTGRWLIKIIKYLPDSSGTLYDFSESMLDVARNKIRDGKLQERIEIINGNLENMRSCKNSQYDIAICFHNPLSFVKNYNKAFGEITKKLKKGGYFILVVSNKYHMLYVNAQTGDIQKMKILLKTDIGSFNEHMPPIRTFTPISIMSLYQKFGLKEIHTYGFPVTIYPQLEDTAISGSGKRTKAILEDADTFAIIEEIEKQLVLCEEAAPRGNSLFVIGRK